MSGSLGANKSSSSTNPAKVWDAQSPFLTDLFQRSQDASNNNQGQLFSQQFQQPSFNAFSNLAGGGQSLQGNQLSGLQDLASGSQQNAALGGAINSGLGQISRNFNRNIMPAINTGAALNNTSGGSRQGIAQGLAASDANQQSADFVNQMQSNNFNSILQSQGQAFGQLNQNNSIQNQSQNAALGQAPQLSNLGFGSQFGNLQNLSGLIGSPTVLSQGGKSNSWGFNTSGGLT